MNPKLQTEIEQIELHYEQEIHNFTKICNLAKQREIDILKRSYAGRKSSMNMTPEQRRERARKAGSTKK